jgi:hypothetical protein
MEGYEIIGEWGGEGQIEEHLQTTELLSNKKLYLENTKNSKYFDAVT